MMQDISGKRTSAVDGEPRVGGLHQEEAMLRIHFISDIIYRTLQTECVRVRVNARNACVWAHTRVRRTVFTNAPPEVQR